MATVIPTTAGAGAPREGHRRAAAMALMTERARVMFVSILVAGALISLVCIFASLSWVDRPFAGVTINERMVVANIGRLNWTGLDRGFKYPDKIVAVDGRPVHSMKELNDIILGSPVGEAHTYLVERGDRRFQLTIPTMRFTWIDLILTFGLMLVAGLMYLSMGTVVFLLKPSARSSWAFLLVAFSLSVYSITAFDVVTTLLGFARLHRQRARVVGSGAALALPAPAAAHAFSLFGGAAIPPNYVAIPLVVFPAAIAYAIAKHNLFDADVYIKRAVGNTTSGMAT